LNVGLLQKPLDSLGFIPDVATSWFLKKKIVGMMTTNYYYYYYY